MIGLLLINLGTPDKPTTSDVRRYLKEFLSDPRVIDIPSIPRWMLVNLIIAPFRSSKSAEAYQKIWTDRGSPLLSNTQDLAQKVQAEMGSHYVVEVGMRYGNPSIASAIQKLIAKPIKEIRILPLFPQYASSSFGSAVEEALRILGSLWNTPPVKVLPAFFNDEGFIRSWAEVAEPILKQSRPDHLVFSFHGLPERQIFKSDPVGNHCLKFGECCEQSVFQNHYCYRAQCFETARLIAKQLGAPSEICSVTFQSRLGRTPWIKPYTDIVIPELIQSGKKRITVFSPSFVADCLETLEEIGIRAKESALALGAEDFTLIPSLNSSPTWVKTVASILK